MWHDRNVLRTHGYPVDFNARPWAEIRDRLTAVADKAPEFDYLVDIVDSVVACGRENDIAVTTRMHDIVVTSSPASPPPLDVVLVLAPSSLSRDRPKPGRVVIEEWAVTGHSDRIERPAEEAVALFWRFMIEKFGIEPAGP